MSYKLPFRPLWIVLPALVVFISLGVWDLDRMLGKAVLMEELQIRSLAPAIPLPADDRIPAADLVFRPVRINGLYLHDSEIRLLNQSRDGELGVAVITPLVRSDGGPTLLVNRGWALADWAGPAADGDEGHVQEVEVTGIVLTPEAPGWKTPPNDPAANEWHYVDLSAMAGSVGVLPFVDYYIYATGEASYVPEPAAPAEGAQTGEADAPAPTQVQAIEPAASPYPIANVWQVDTSNDHLTYAVFWFSLAALLLAVSIVYRTHIVSRVEEEFPD